MSALLAFFTVDGVGWDPFLGGALTVITGTLVLMGSVYVLLATNSGARTGMLLALAGFCGWMFIMGIIWWIYGIGLAGAAPTWEIQEVNIGNLEEAQFERARDLSTWTDLPASDGSRGEAQATVDAFLASDSFGQSLFPPDGDAGASYVPLANAWEFGGKDVRTDDSMLGRVIHKLKVTFVQVRHPPHYALLQVQAADPATLIIRAGEKPPIKAADASQPPVSILLLRNLGDVRLPPAMVTLVFGILFAILCQALHSRDAREDEIRSRLVSA